MLRQRQTHTKRRFIFVLVFAMFFLINDGATDTLHAEDTSVDRDEIESYMMDIIDWKKEHVQSNDGNLLSNEFLENAGETSADWYVIGLGRSGVDDDFASYTAIIKNHVEKRYQTEEKLSNAKATEWHRIALAILAAGGDPTAVGEDENGSPIDLIADGTYNRGKDSRSLGAQGLNGWIWALITLDSMRYNIPDDAVETRDSMIEEILRAQLEDGGFALNTFEKDADVDLTAMAIQALAPYYNSEETYTYEQVATEEDVTKTVREVTDEALQLLSDEQSDNGDYEMTGISNVESTAQVMVALTALGIDPLTDERFIKNDYTLLDAILSYQRPDGGFIHSETHDAENEWADPDESNSMASEQVLYTLTALYRFYDGKRSLYDFREDMSAEDAEKVDNAIEAIEAISSESQGEENIKDAFAQYEKVPVTERSYVVNYAKLADAMKEEGIDNTSAYLAESMGQHDDGKGSHPALFADETDDEGDTFTPEDEEKAASIRDEPLSTEHYVEVVTYIDKIREGTSRDDYDDILADLEDLKLTMEDKQDEIDAINQLILNELYPFSQVTKDDQATIDDIMQRYEALTAYDQDKIQDYEAVEKAATQLDKTARGTYITIGIIVVITGLLIVLIIRHKKRKKAKLKQKMLDVAE